MSEKGCPQSTDLKPAERGFSREAGTVAAGVNGGAQSGHSDEPVIDGIFVGIAKNDVDILFRSQKDKLSFAGQGRNEVCAETGSAGLCATWRVATGGMDRVQPGWGCSLKSHVH
jgi:hypothetical protein